MKKFSFGLILAGIFCFLSGCGGEKYPDGLPKIYPVTVNVTQEGKPLEGATVVFAADESSDSRWGVGGCTDAAGKAIMSVNGKYKGCPAGKYKVVVSKSVTESNQDKIPPAPDAVKDPKAFGEWYHQYGEMPIVNKVFSLVEDKYSNSKTTPLSVEVTENGEKTFSLDAGKAVHKEDKVTHGK